MSAESDVGRKKSGRKKESFYSGFLILTLSTVIVKLIGLIYKIPMLSLLGSEGMGYFNSAYEIYALFCIVSTAGLPVAMSVMISGRGQERAERIFRVARRIFFMLGIVGTAIMIAFARPFSEFLKNGNAALCILFIAPTVFFICLCGAYRGYFQGHGKMLPTAISQIIEAAGKLILGLLFAYIAQLLGYGTVEVAAAGVLGVVCGTALSALYLALSKKRQKTIEYEKNDFRLISKELICAAVPITLSSAVLSVSKLIDMSMIIRRLQSIGYSSAEAFSTYGSYTTLALPLFSLAPALVSAVALPLVPALSHAIAKGKDDEQANTVTDALKLTSIIAMPLGVGMSLFSKQLLSLVFKGEAQAIEVSAPLLSMLGVSVTMSCFITVGNAVLQAYGKCNIPIVSMVAGAIVKIALAFLLIGDPEINILGAPISTFACDLTINVINFYFIFRLVPREIAQSKILVRPFCAAFTSVLAARFFLDILNERMSDTVATLLSVTSAAILYAASCIVFKVIDKDDVSKIPIINKTLNYSKSEEEKNERTAQRDGEKREYRSLALKE